MEKNLQEELYLLLDKARYNRASQPDFKRLVQLINADDSGEAVKIITAYWEKKDQDQPDNKTAPGRAYWEDAFKEITALHTRKSATIQSVQDKKIRKITSFRRWGWAAACVLVLMGVGYYIYNNKFSNFTGNTIAGNAKDIQPGSRGALLTLADGTKIVLDSLHNGLVATESGTKILLKDGQLSYQPIDGSSVLSYNKITVPKGRHYSIMLPDGSKVWLNAQTQFSYPIRFEADKRVVELEGEAYFEVTAYKREGRRLPFIVKTGKQEVEVLGTSFNVMAYADETSDQTTLVEGAVRVHSGDQSIVLSPGEQGLMNDKRLIKRKVDPGQYIAWKNDEFIFNETELTEALRMLARWYNVELQYDANIAPTYLYGSISRKKDLAEVLKIMEETGLKFKVIKTGNADKLIILKE